MKSWKSGNSCGGETTWKSGVMRSKLGPPCVADVPQILDARVRGKLRFPGLAEKAREKEVGKQKRGWLSVKTERGCLAGCW